MKLEENNLKENEYMIIYQASPRRGVVGIVNFYFNTDEWELMRKFASAEIQFINGGSININGVNIYDFYASGEQPSLNDLRKVVHKSFPRVEDEIINQVAKYYE